MNELNTTVVEGVISVVGILLIYLGIELRKWIAKVENEYMQGVLMRLSDAVETSVREAMQTVVPALKESAEDGKLSREEIAQIKKQVRIASIDQLTKIDKRQLEKLFDPLQLERRIDREIEALVQRLKS